MKSENRHDSKGFTLIETLIVIAIGLAMLTALASLIESFYRTAAYQVASEHVSGSASATMREMESLIPSADAVLASYTFPDATYTSSSTVLVLKLPSIDSTGTVITNAYDYAAIYRIGNSAYSQIEASANSARPSGTTLLSAYVQSLTFTYNSADPSTATAVTVDLKTETSAGSNTLTDHRNEYLGLRN